MSPVLAVSPAAYFDSIAARYDTTWTNTRAGRLQRTAVWRHIDPLIRCGDRILDMGCGTGEDALHLRELGGQVLAIDASTEMIGAARAKGVDARVLPIEDIHALAVTFDLIVSNFGALNCICDLSTVQKTLLRLVRPGGYLAVCVMNRFCLWESAYYTLRGQFKKAIRRWLGEAHASHGFAVFYPSRKHIRSALSPGFALIADIGIGIALPPSFVGTMRPGLLDTLASVDARIETTRIGRSIGDHRVLIFRRE